ncbi:MAG: sulfatase-like hydrolase/transferase, partial [Actinomycetota bacterium]
RAEVPWAAELDRQRLLLEVNYADRLVGDVIDRLEEVGLYDEALVVLTSDHGLAFEPGASARGIGDRAVEREIEADLLWVPLFVKAPGQTVGEVSDVDARTIDVVPTIAGHLDVEMPWPVDGIDLEGPAADDREAKRFVRVQGSSFAIFEVDDPIDVRAELDEVFAQGTDAHLDGTGEERWWDVGPRRDLVKARIGDLLLGANSESRIDVDRAGDYEDIDLSTGEAPLLATGRIHLDGEHRPDGGPLLAVLVDDVIAAVVPTFPDDNGPGRFAALIDPELFNEPGRRVRFADVLDGPDGATTLRLIPELDG